MSLSPELRGPRLKWHTVDGFTWLVIRSLVRYLVTGKPLWGPGDNATWLHAATADYRGGPVEKLGKARWRRVAYRWALIGIPLVIIAIHGIGWSLFAYALPWAVTGATIGILHFRAWWPQRHVRRDFVYPIWTVLCKITGEKFNKRAAVRAIELPAEFGTEGDHQEELSVRINLPLIPLDDGLKRRIVLSAGERLGLSDPASSWVVRGTRAYVDLSPRTFPPRKLVFADVRSLWLEADPAKPLVGLAAGRKPVYADLDNEGPHIGVSAGTGAGKSTLLRLVLSRRMMDGSALVVCDYKVTSHPWAARIAREDSSRCLYVTDEEEIHEAILKVFGEFQRRRNILKTSPEALEDFRRVDLLIEELNSLAMMLRKWWGHERKRLMAIDKDEFYPVTCPSVDAMAALVQMGRELRMHVHMAGQRLDASAISPRDGGAVRESISNRFLAKYTRKAWAMLCDVPYEAFPGGPRGIWTAVMTGSVVHFRVPWQTNEEAYELVMRSPRPSGGLLSGSPVRRQVEAPVTLSEALPALSGCPSIDALRKAVQRAELKAVGKRGNADLFELEALRMLYPTSQIES